MPDDAPPAAWRPASRRHKLGAGALLVCLSAILAMDIWCGLNVHRLAMERAAIKKDYSVVNEIKFGLLSADRWRDIFVQIANDQIQGFSLDEQDEANLEASLTNVIDRLITSADSLVQHGSHGIGGKIRKLAINTFVDWDKLRARAPEFARAAVKEAEKPQTNQKLKELAKKKVAEYAARTGDHGTAKGAEAIPRILQRHGAADVAQFNAMARDRIDLLQSRTYVHTYAIIGSLLLVLLAWLLLAPRVPEIRRPLFAVSVLLGLVVLLVALTTPILDIDARLKEVDFLLLGERVQFPEQVLFFETRSILGVVRTLMATKKPDSMFVGVLILAFSILFPIAKLIATEVHLLGSARVRRSRFVNFLAFHSGKWSMADVTVVAIFMAYIGFKAILDDQLSGLTVETSRLSSVATNLTSLQPGFLLFLAFVCYGLILSEILKWITRRGRHSGGEADPGVPD